MTAPLEKRQQSNQTQSIGIPGGNKSGRKMFGFFSLHVWYFLYGLRLERVVKVIGLCMRGKCEKRRERADAWSTWHRVGTQSMKTAG